MLYLAFICNMWHTRPGLAKLIYSGHRVTALFYESILRVSELEGTCDTCAQQPQNRLPIDPDPANPLSPLKFVNSPGEERLERLAAMWKPDGRGVAGFFIDLQPVFNNRANC
jgi:hypothetical protein